MFCNVEKSRTKGYLLSWLKEVDSCLLRCAIFNLEDSFKNFFEKRSSYPKFKSKYYKQSYRTNTIRSTYKGKEYSNIKLAIKKKQIKLPKLGLVYIRGYKNKDYIEGEIINASINIMFEGLKMYMNTVLI